MMGLWFAVTAAQASTLDELGTRAVQANPGVEAARQAVEATEAQSRVAGAWPDPVVAVEYSNVPVDSFVLGQHPMSGVQIRAMQVLRPPNWSARKRKPLELVAAGRAHAVEEAEIQVRAAVARVWWSLTQTRILRRITEEHLARANELLGAVTARYEVGATGQSSVLRMQVLRDRLADELGDFDRAEAELLARLAAVLGQVEPPEADTPDGVEPMAIVEVDWVGVADASRPMLAQIEAEIEAAEARAVAARADAAIDPALSVGYRLRLPSQSDPGTDFFGGGVSVPIPTGSGRRANGARMAALAEASGLRNRLADVRNDVAAAGAATAARWERAFDKAEEYRTSLIPQATTALETTQADFAVGKAGFSSLFDAEVALLRLERAVVIAAIETHRMQVEAELLVGAPLDVP